MPFIDSHILLTGLVVFFARICDVAIGTIRTIVTVQGRAVTAFFLAVLEIFIWISVAGAVINQIQDKPALSVFYAFGYATGNVIGILVERKLAFGLIIFKVITSRTGTGLADALRAKGQPVTMFRGEGMSGPVSELYMACKRKHLKWILPLVTAMDPDAFYIIEQAREMRKGMIPISHSFRWMGIDKRK
jgi:uncharacterized protein YebE (UPF0316 family)